MKNISLSKINPTKHPLCKSKSEATQLTSDLKKELYDLLYLMFAHNKYSLLIILQGIDTAGKDGAIRSIFSAANPQGVRVYSFKKPTEEEARHDFLWRCHQHAPESGLTAIFNRSYYEEVSKTMVHPDLLKNQNIPDEYLNKRNFFQNRYERINDFEKMLSQKGTLVIKFFLHISKDEQKIRIQERLNNRSKNWKFSDEDIKDREHWDEYMRAYNKMIAATNTKYAPWHIIPADNKWYRDYLVSKTLVEALENLPMQFPKAKKVRVR